MMLVRRGFVAPEAAPDEVDDQGGGNEGDDIQAASEEEQAVPVRAELGAGHADGDRPDDGAEGVVGEKSPPRHMVQPGDGTGEDAQAGDEAGEENGERFVAVKVGFRAGSSGAAEMESAADPFAGEAAEGVSDALAHDAGCAGHQDELDQAKGMLRAAVIAG